MAGQRGAGSVSVAVSVGVGFEAGLAVTYVLCDGIASRNAESGCGMSLPGGMHRGWPPSFVEDSDPFSYHPKSDRWTMRLPGAMDCEVRSV